MEFGWKNTLSHLKEMEIGKFQRASELIRDLHCIMFGY